MLTTLLEERGHEVVSFVRKAVDNAEISASGGKLAVDEWIASEDGRKKFEYETDGATQSDLIIYIGPSGIDAWAEVGAAWGSDRIILGLWAKGEQVGLMRRLVDIWVSDYRELLEQIEALSPKK